MPLLNGSLFMGNMLKQPITNSPQSYIQGLYWMPHVYPYLIAFRGPIFPFEIISKHQTLLCFEHALRLPQNHSTSTPMLQTQ